MDPTVKAIRFPLNFISVEKKEEEKEDDADATHGDMLLARTIYLTDRRWVNTVCPKII